MPPRSTPPPNNRGGFQPPNDASTFKDLLHFEERLKINAARLKKRKRKYQGEVHHAQLDMNHTDVLR
jgi:hypothetical protein